MSESPRNWAVLPACPVDWMAELLVLTFAQLGFATSQAPLLPQNFRSTSPEQQFRCDRQGWRYGKYPEYTCAVLLQSFVTPQAQQ
jgi:hypothetical protein